MILGGQNLGRDTCYQKPGTFGQETQTTPCAILNVSTTQSMRSHKKTGRRPVVR